MIKILLVEDNEMNRDMLSRRLERRGYDVITADNGHSAVELAITAQPDIILMDMELPVKDGWTASKEIKSQQNTPIIALTAHALSDDRDRAYSAGCDHYATKPIDFAALLDIIAQLTA